jgi:hypothetical protein
VVEMRSADGHVSAYGVGACSPLTAANPPTAWA